MAGARDLRRLLTPQSVAVVGGGFWCENVIAELGKIGFEGDVWRVHPREGFAKVRDLPAVPDAAFIGVNRVATLDVVADLAELGCGGAVCFASGYAEAAGELSDAGTLQSALLNAASHMPILGPNCYGMINYLDRVALWPDQHGGKPVARGVAIVTQSSNIAINLTMQARGLPLGFVVTAGNQAQQGVSQLACALLDDPRITTVGLHVEGLGDLSAFWALAERAQALGKTVVVLKVGSSEEAQVATVSHTASLSGSEAGARALFARAGFAQVRTIEGFVEALKIAHLHGGLPSAQVASLSCSGGEASLMADIGGALGVAFPPLVETQEHALREALGPHVALANPLDYHTYIWGDEAAMTRVFSAMMTSDHAMGLLVLDTPRADRCDARAWEPAFRAVARAQEESGRPMAVLASLAETMPEDLADRLMDQGIVPLCGMPAALEAIAALAVSASCLSPAWPPRESGSAALLSETESKQALACAGIAVPRGACVAAADLADAAQALVPPLVLKASGVAHKSEAGGVALGLRDADAVRAAARVMGGAQFLLEEMVDGASTELLIGILSDPAHGMVLTVGRGGIETELLGDVTHALLPVSADEVRDMLLRLRCAPVLQGFRGRPGADIDAIVQVVMAMQALLEARPGIVELEINPLLCKTDGAIAVDALIREEQA
ncbi:acetate--CoA ligase family protein [Primorskyibacter sp. S187A]|uniref:acetate--CoA ligase family protein n=1 Tax=Primorskyibacter sp. S187A TaxID=3415130 RepID=UPI003C7D1D01